jgi:hypothetical protein
MDENQKPFILVFGGTGKVGRHVRPYALSQGFRLRAFVRSPDKLKNIIDSNSPDLDIFQGDLTNEESVIQGCEGNVKYVIFVAGMPNFKWNRQKKWVMTNGIKSLQKGMTKHGIKRMLYLAGTPNPAPNQKLSFGIKFLKLFLIICLGDKWNIKDNDSVISFLTHQDQIDYIVIRPLFFLSHLTINKLKASPKVGGIVTFSETGRFAVDAVQDNNLIGSFPYVSR